MQKVIIHAESDPWNKAIQHRYNMKEPQKGWVSVLNKKKQNMKLSAGSAKDLVGQEPNVAGHKVKVASANDDGDGDDDIKDIDLDEDTWALATVTPLAQEKEIAAEVIGDISYN